MGDDYYGYENCTEEGRGEKGGGAEKGCCAQEGRKEGRQEEVSFFLR